MSFFFKAVKKHDTARRRQLDAARFGVAAARASVGALAAESAGCSAAAVVQLVCCEGAVAVQLVGL